MNSRESLANTGSNGVALIYPAVTAQKVRVARSEAGMCGMGAAVRRNECEDRAHGARYNCFDLARFHY